MCTIVKFTDSEKELWSITELKDAGVFVHDNDKPNHVFNDESCLCVLDIEAIIKRTGLEYTYDEDHDVFRIERNVRRK